MTSQHDATLPAWVKEAPHLQALNCPHTITHDEITLRYDPDQPGANALAQLADRLSASMDQSPYAIVEQAWQEAWQMAYNDGLGAGHPLGRSYLDCDKEWLDSDAYKAVTAALRAVPPAPADWDKSCPACEGAGTISTGIAEASETLCEKCDGIGVAPPAPVSRAELTLHDADLSDLIRQRIHGLSVYQQADVRNLIRELLAQSAPLNEGGIEPVACERCGGSGFVDDGEITGSGGVDFENGPVKCVKDCPDCAAPQPVAINEGGMLVRVRKEKFEALMDALDRAEGKGYLPDAIAQEWQEFDYVSAPQPSKGDVIGSSTFKQFCHDRQVKVSFRPYLADAWITAQSSLRNALTEAGILVLERDDGGWDIATPQPSALPDRDASKPAEQQGLFRKFDVRRVDGSDQPGGKHHGCEYFVIDVDHDAHAGAALMAYAAACEATHPDLARDLRAKWCAPLQPSAKVLTDEQREAIDFCAGFIPVPRYVEILRALLADHSRDVTKLAAEQPSEKALTEAQITAALVAFDNVDVENKIMRENMRRALLAAEQPKCQTCNGHGMIGGPSYYQPDEGGERCPDCAEQPSEDKR